MKAVKMMIAALAMLVLAGCSKQDPFEGIRHNGADLSFARERQGTIDLSGTWRNCGSDGMNSEMDSVELLTFTPPNHYETAFRSQTKTGIVEKVEKGIYRCQSNLLIRTTSRTAESNETPFELKGKVIRLFNNSAMVGMGAEQWDEYRLVTPVFSPIPARMNGDQVCATLTRSLHVTGTMIFETKTIESYVMRETSSFWTMELDIQNGTSFTIDLGNDLLLVELADSGDYVGFVRVRGPVKGYPASRRQPRPDTGYLLNSFDSTDGGRSLTIQGSKFVFKGSGVHPDGAGFGSIPPQTTEPLFEEIGVDQWLNADFRRNVVIALPEFIVRAADGLQHYRLLVTFKKTDTADTVSHWTVLQQDLIPIRSDSLTVILESADYSLYKRIMAANWLMQNDPEAGGRLLVALCQKVSDGGLLASCLELCSFYKVKGLESRAVELLKATGEPPGIASRCATYLGSVRYSAAIAMLDKSATSTNEAVSSASIEALGMLATDEAVGVLARLLKECNSASSQSNTIKMALENINTPAARDILGKTAKKNTE